MCRYVDGEDAKSLMQRSQLPNEFLAIVWQLSDRDNDGKLNFAEFLIAMHLITRCKKGDFRSEELAQLPSLESALPGHLETILQNSEVQCETLSDFLGDGTHAHGAPNGEAHVRPSVMFVFVFIDSGDRIA